MIHSIWNILCYMLHNITIICKTYRKHGYLIVIFTKLTLKRKVENEKKGRSSKMM